MARHETKRKAELVHKGQQPLISETMVNTGDKMRSRRDSTRSKKYGLVPMTYPGPPAYKLAGPECR